MVRKRSNSLGELDSPFNAVGSLMRHMNSVLNINKPKYDPVIEDRKPTMQELLDSEEKTIKILLELADDLDKVYRDCQISYAVSKGAALAGNIITFAGAISATVTFGVTLPLVITGPVLSSVGIAISFGTDSVKKLINKEKIRKAKRLLGAHWKLVKSLEDELKEEDSMDISEVMMAFEILLTGSVLFERGLADSIKVAEVAKNAGDVVDIVSEVGVAVFSASGARIISDIKDLTGLIQEIMRNESCDISRELRQTAAKIKIVTNESKVNYLDLDELDE